MKYLWSLIFNFMFLLIFEASYGQHQPHWIIVFDAGSTKTRMNMFKVEMDDDGSWYPTKSKISKWKKALSRFNPDNILDQRAIKNGFKKLLTEAGKDINDNEVKKATPVFLFATAGLRALQKPIAMKLLNLSQEAIRKSGFDKLFIHNGPKRVQEISGATEGLYAWLSVNYLTSQDLEQQRADEDIGVMDMGGGSTQIAFRPDSVKKVKQENIPLDSLWNMDGMNNGPGVYSKSFSNFGLMAIVMKYLGAFNDCGSDGKCPRGKVYASKCLHPNFKSTFKFGPNLFKIHGKSVKNPEQRFKICKSRARTILKNEKYMKTFNSISNLLQGRSVKFVAVSGYYYVAKYISKYIKLERNVNIAENEKCIGYRLTVDIFTRGAKQLCNNVPNGNIYKAISCITSTYISALLSDAYKLAGNTEIFTCKAILLSSPNRTMKLELGWPLGVAFEGAETIIEESLNPSESE